MTPDAELEAALEKGRSVGRPLMEEQSLVELEARFGRPLRDKGHILFRHINRSSWSVPHPLRIKFPRRAVIILDGYAAKPPSNSLCKQRV